MKTLLLGIFCLGLANLGNSQTSTSTVALADIVITPLNLNYLNAVKEKDAPAVVKKLENEAARFDITEDPTFDRKFHAYEVIFKEKANRGSIVATYNKDGEIIKSLEKFNDVRLPVAVRNAVYKAYPEWTIHSDTYLVSYFSNRQVKKSYKLKIKKDNKSKTLKIDTLGKLL